MDVNGTRFHLLTGADDWEPYLEQAAPVDLRWDSEQAGLTLLPQVLHFASGASETPLTPDDRRGADSDAYGNIYWIDSERRGIRLQPAGTTDAGDYWRLDELDQTCNPGDGAFSPLPGPAAGEATRLCGLAVTREHYLVVGTCAPGGLLIFDLHGGGPPRWWQWPADLIFAPFDLAAAADGGVWILARKSDLTPARLWRLDCHFQFLPWGDPAPAASTAADFAPFGSPPPQIPARASTINLRPGSGLAVAINAPIAVAGLPDDSVLILGSSPDAAYSVIVRYRDGVLSNRIELNGGILERVLENPQVRAHDFAFLSTATGYPDEVAGELSLVLEDGNQALVFGLEAFRDSLTLTIRPRYVPLRRYSGKALVAGTNAVYYDLDQRWYKLTAQPRCRYVTQARLEGMVFDGGEPGCVWHRVLLDAYIPDGAHVEIYTRAGDDAERLDELEWTREPAPYLRGDGAEVIQHHPFSADELAIAGTGTWELLLQRANGRYLELALVLTGDGRTTPRIRAMRLYYPRFSYLRNYLPAVYREDTHSASFLDRYLANAEGILAVVEDRIARAEVYFDSRTAPAESLAWLAAWLGAALEEEWDEARKRLFVANAELLFRWRGTLIGMRAMIRLITEPCPDDSLFDDLRNPGIATQAALGGKHVRIVERFRYRELPGVVIGDPTDNVELQTTSLTDASQELGDPAQLNSEYRAFLQQRYGTADTLSKRWGTTYTSFAAIVFTPQPPSGAERSDWLLFVQRRLALSRAWTPAQGAYALHLRYQEFLRRHYSTPAGSTQTLSDADALKALDAAWGTDYATFDAIRFSPVLPAAAAIAQDWLAFLHDGIGFTYAPVSDTDLATYRQFLARRYRNIAALNAAYGLTQETAWTGFDAIALPAENELPAGGPALADWTQFVSLTLPIRRNAHRFTVLVPTEPGELPDTRAQRIGQVDAIVQREKPAHTDYDVKLFWALFQVGTARLGEDTTLGESARYVAIVLGGTYLGQGLVGSGQPWNVSGRNVLGRDRLT